MRTIRNALAELIESHYERQGEEARCGDQFPPHPLLKGWWILERIRVNSSDYLLLRRIHAAIGGVRAGVNVLTPREREAVRWACMGTSNKEVAYQMNISPSTVGVLLGRASRKLGAVDRHDLILRARHLRAARR